MERTRFVGFVGMASMVGLAVVAGCTLKASSGDTCGDPHCSANPSGPVHGVTADGRVDTTAAQAWPNRPTVDPGPVTDEDVAKACAAYGACLSTFAQPPVSSTDDETIAIATALCTLPDGGEERVIPMGSHNERWSWWIRAIVANPTCDAIAKLQTDRDKDIYCEEDGCWSTAGSKPSVQCTGSVAAIESGGESFVRDCARSYTTCDENSVTGCSDRSPTACDPRGNDRCDGNIKLGCDRNGLVSFHDCALIHATCQESADGAKCVTNPDAGCDTSAQVCTGTQLTLCTFGAKTTIDCAAMGFAGCNRGHCTLK
jgi:hypothetical protein